MTRFLTMQRTRRSLALGRCLYAATDRLVTHHVVPGIQERPESAAALHNFHQIVACRLFVTSGAVTLLAERICVHLMEVKSENSWSCRHI